MAPADAWIDPSEPKPRAWVTHGHGDHARGGHGAVLATPETLAIMEVRYGPQSGQPNSSVVGFTVDIVLSAAQPRFLFWFEAFSSPEVFRSPFRSCA